MSAHCSKCDTDLWQEWVEGKARFYCPVCEAEKEIKKLRAEVTRLKRALEATRGENDRLKDKDVTNYDLREEVKQLYKQLKIMTEWGENGYKGISLCKFCMSMTKTVCGKCGKVK
jgi:uncharacterized Zn finger protein (UPF0148 family)